MSADDRLTRLRALVDQIERLPASRRRDWMLAEARARMVDVETGERPRGMRPLDEEPPLDSPERSARRTADAPAVKRPPRHLSGTAEHRGGNRQSAPASGIAAADETANPVDVEQEPPFAMPESTASALGTDGVLWLEDSAPADGVDGHPKSRLWTRGLRG